MPTTIKRYLYYFFIFAIAGYLWEVLVNIFTLFRLANPGTMYGPWLPIYGWFVLLLLLLPDGAKDRPMKVFLVSFIMIGIIEYATSAFLEHFYHTKWWDYSRYLFDINGRVCLEALFVFSSLSILIIHYVVPKLDKLFNKINGHVLEIILIIILLLFIFDYGYSIFHPHHVEHVDIKELFD